MILIVDASVAMRWYVTGAGTEAALSLLAGDAILVAPDLIVAEVSHAAWKLVRAQAIGADHGERIAAAIAGSFSLLVSSRDLSRRAFAMARQLEHPVYDCLYLALAEMKSAQLVTADERLLGRIRNTPLRKLARPLLT